MLPKTHMHNTKHNQGFCKEMGLQAALDGLGCKEKEERKRNQWVSEQQIISKYSYIQRLMFKIKAMQQMLAND